MALPGIDSLGFIKNLIDPVSTQPTNVVTYYTCNFIACPASQSVRFPSFVIVGESPTIFRER